jgi:hypothetical protein
MVSPINYMMNVRSPFEQAMRGFEFGQAGRLREAQEARTAEEFPLILQQRQQTMDIQRAQEARAASAFEQQRRAAAAAQARAEAMRSAMVGLAENPGATAEDYAQLMMRYPEIGQDLQRGWDMMSEPRQRTILRDMAQVYSAIDTGNLDIARGLLEQRIEAARNSGREDDAQQAELILRTMEVDPRAARTTLGISLRALGGSEFDELLTGGRPTLRSSEILPDGTIVGVTDQGPVVYSPTGEVVTGEAAATAIRQAQEFGAEVRQAREAAAATGRLETERELAAGAAGARAAGTAGIEVGRQTFERIGPIRSNISNLERAIELVEEEGANTGVLASRFPAWSASTIELRQLQNVLGLDVIGSVTFGALSEGELQLALDTALPTNLSEDALADWLRRKRDAQEALVDNLTMQANFLSVPGRTLDQWIEFTESGGDNMADMRAWMRENPVGRRAPAVERPAAEEEPRETSVVQEDRDFIAAMQAKIEEQGPQSLTPEEIARLNRIAGQ